MENYTINMTQRTGAGDDQSAETNMYVIRWAKHGDIFVTDDPALTGIQADAYTVEAVVKMVHPWCLFGDEEEILCSMRRLVIDKLLDEGRITCNEMGVNFWED